ncbi:MAG: DUF1569 domain-containing protein [Planctomycetota bacterium]|jgi:hypothetical protein
MVKTRKVADRRSLRFGRMSEILADAEQLGASESLRSSGNWTPAQNVAHVATVIRGSIDGFEASAPWWMRGIGRLIRSRTLNHPMSPGFKVPSNMRSFVPDPSVGWDEALAELRAQIGRLDAGERMTRPSPVFGELSHEEWEQLHCRHAEMHFGFLHG